MMTLTETITLDRERAHREASATMPTFTEEVKAAAKAIEQASVIEALAATVEEVGKGRWTVASRTRALPRIIVLKDGKLHCSCPARVVCAHIRAMQAVTAPKPCECYGCRTQSRYGCCREAAQNAGLMQATIATQTWECR